MRPPRFRWRSRSRWCKAEDSFTLVGGEDVDFGLRVTKLGYQWITSTEALVLHRRSPITRLSHVFERLFIYGRADVFLADHHPDRRDSHANPYAVGLVALAGALLATGRRRRFAVAAAGLLPVVTLVAEARRRAFSTATLYGDRPGRAEEMAMPGGTREVPRQLQATVIDSMFDAGVTWEALRRRKPHRAFVRFRYVDDVTFRPRRRS